MILLWSRIMKTKCYKHWLPRATGTSTNKNVMQVLVEPCSGEYCYSLKCFRYMELMVNIKVTAIAIQQDGMHGTSERTLISVRLPLGWMLEPRSHYCFYSVGYKPKPKWNNERSENREERCRIAIPRYKHEESKNATQKIMHSFYATFDIEMPPPAHDDLLNKYSKNKDDTK